MLEVTRPDLVHPPTDDAPLPEHLEFARVVTGAATATLLRLDDSRSVLEPVLAIGFGRRWRVAMPVRVGVGFAGRVAETRQPLILEHLDETTVVNAILRTSGLQRLMGVPVEHGGRLLGVLHVGRRDGALFTDVHLRELAAAAARIAQWWARRAEDDDHLVALTLQRSLLPNAPPVVNGLDVAVRYLPADGRIGGDWYDVFDLPEDRVAFVVGDVQGHGLSSAIIMGRLRSALRAYAFEDPDPAAVVGRLDRLLCHFEGGSTATLVYAVTSPPFDTLLLANAGHPRPMLRESRGTVRTIDAATGPLLGWEPSARRRTAEVDLPSGSTVLLYTDGLLDRRTDLSPAPYDQRLTMMREAMMSELEPDALCAHVMAQTVGDDMLDDDVTMLLLRRTLDPVVAHSPDSLDQPCP